VAVIRVTDPDGNIVVSNTPATDNPLGPPVLPLAELIAVGVSNAEIAGRLVMSVPTAKTHVSRIPAKLGARDRAQLVVIAHRSGLVRA